MILRRERRDIDVSRKPAATVSSCNRRKREREARDISGNADRCGRVRRDRRRSRVKIQCAAHAGKRRKGPRWKYSPFLRAAVALRQDSASERPSALSMAQRSISPQAGNGRFTRIKDVVTAATDGRDVVDMETD